jgi:hypothetical protein
MPAMIRAGGKMWNAAGKIEDTKARLPESTFARIIRKSISTSADQRRLRPDHHGYRAQRRPDGPEGRGIRFARQHLKSRKPAKPASSLDGQGVLL